MEPVDEQCLVLGHGTGQRRHGATSHVGGIVGDASNITLSNCDFAGNAGGYTVGGIVGYGSAEVHLGGNSVNRGTITASQTAGGIIGYFTAGSNISTAYNLGTVTGGAGAEGIAGGIIGESKANIKITDCVNTGAVTAYTAGGIVGKDGLLQTGEMTRCYNIGIIAGDTTGGYAGGLVGYGNGHYTDSYNRGDVSGYIAGGLGRYDTPAQAATITRCYNHGNITGSRVSSGIGCAGGLIGYGFINIVNSYNKGVVDAYVSGGFNGIINGTAWSPSVQNSYNAGTVVEYSGGSNNQIYGIMETGAGTVTTVTDSYCRDNTGATQNLKVFSGSQWPAGWTVSQTNGWASLGWWHATSPQYPVLWMDATP